MLKYALLIGVNYTNSKYELRGAIASIRNVKKMLIDKLNFLEKNIIVLTDHTQIRATGINIIEQLNSLFCRANKDGCNQIWIHYAGYGQLPSNNQNNAIMVGSDYNIVPHNIINKILSNISSNMQLTWIIDCCFAGQITALHHKYNTIMPLENRASANIQLITATVDRSKPLYSKVSYEGGITRSLLHTLEIENYHWNLKHIFAGMSKYMQYNLYEQQPVVYTIL